MKRSPIRRKSRSKASPAEQRYMAAVAALACALCTEIGIEQSARTEVHHVRESQGLSQRAGHYCVVPLCGDCHRGRTGIHGDRTPLRIARVSEMDLLNMTIAKLMGEVA